MNHLDTLENEAIFILREVIGQFKNPVILFSGGKDSTLLIHLAIKACYPFHVPLPVLHIDTGHNFPEVIEFRDLLVKRYNLNLIVRKVSDTIIKHNITEEKNKLPSRNAMQSVTLLDAIQEFGFDACIGGGRRDEDKDRAKERIFSIRDKSGTWQPYKQRPELWNIYNGNINVGENVRVFPISNWSELDVWQYIKREHIALPIIYFSHQRKCLLYNDKLIAISEFITIDQKDIIRNIRIRYRTVGDMTCTAAVESNANNVEEVIAEISRSNISERGQTRMDDNISDAAIPATALPAQQHQQQHNNQIVIVARMMHATINRGEGDNNYSLSPIMSSSNTTIK